MTEQQKNFLGIPVEGSIIRGGHNSIPQREIEELAPFLQAALAVEGLDSIRWRQYTPFFSDGDPCYFSVGDIMFKPTKADDAVEEDDEDEGGDWGDGYLYASDAAICGGYRTRWNSASNRYENIGAALDGIPGHEALAAFKEQVDSGAFENALLEAFGDHAIVTVFRDRIEVEEYEHD